MADTSETPPGTRGPSRSAVRIVGAVLLVATAALIVWAVWWAADGGDSNVSVNGTSTTAASNPTTTAPTSSTAQPTIAERQFGQPLKAGAFEIAVRSAGPARLHEAAGEPPAGYHRLEVAVSMLNTSDSGIPLNGVPYAAHETVLTVDGQDYAGVLVSAFRSLVRQGNVPPGEPLNLRFVFDIPDASQEATFTWPAGAAFPSYPTIVVPIPGESLQAR